MSGQKEAKYCPWGLPDCREQSGNLVMYAEWPWLLQLLPRTNFTSLLPSLGQVSGTLVFHRERGQSPPPPQGSSFPSIAIPSPFLSCVNIFSQHLKL